MAGRPWASQIYKIIHEMAEGHRVGDGGRMERNLGGALWLDSGGEQMKAYFAVFLEFEGGRITQLRNYDCFEPW